jgi:hypothetical protein
MILAIAKTAVLVALCAFLCAATAAAIELRREMTVLTPKVAGALDSVRSIAQSTSDVEEATYATEGEVANLADSMSGIANGLASHEESELQQAQDASRRLSTLLEHADADVVGLGAAEQAAAVTITGIGTDSHATMDAARGVLADAATQVGNPAIAASLEDIRDSATNVKLATAQISVTTEQMTATANDVRQVADRWRAQALAPVSTAKRIGLAIASFAGTFAGHFF